VKKNSEQDGAPQVAAGCSRLTRKTWSNAEKRAVLDLLAFFKGMKRQTIDFLRSRYGNAFKTVTASTLQRWQEAQQRALEAGQPGALNKKRGKKVCDDFGLEVCARVAEASASNESGNPRLYASIAETAEQLRNTDKWQNDERVQRLKFSAKWCHTAVRRHNEQTASKRITIEGAPVADVSGAGMEATAPPPRDKKRRGEPKPARCPAVEHGGERGMLRGGGRYPKAGDSKKGAASLLRVKTLEEEVASLRQQLDKERKRSAALEQQLLAMRAHGETLPHPAQGGRGCGVLGGVPQGFVPVALHPHAAAQHAAGDGGADAMIQNRS
jgi:hypothetical protein